MGAAQIRAGAVRSSEVRDGSLQASDLSAGARQTLGGGGSGRVFFAHVGGGGEADCGNATFAAPAGRITLHQDGDHVGVQTYDAGGDPANLPFDVIMAC